MSNTLSSQFWVKHPLGRIFVRAWSPESEPGTSRHKSPIVLFHDSLGCVELWRDFPMELSAATGRRVIAYDRLGFGQSDYRADKLNIDFIRDEAVSIFPVLRQEAGFDRFIAFGHSVGGGMAAHCAAEHAASCDALITEAAQAFVEDKTRAGILEAKELFQQQEPFERLRRYHGERTRWVLDAWIETWLSPEFSSWSLEAVLPRIKCPALAIHGGDDEYGSCAHPRMIARLTGGPVQIEIMPGVRHVPHREQGPWVAGRVADFIATLRL